MFDFETQLIQKIEGNFEKIKKDLQSKIKRKDFERYSVIQKKYDSGVSVENDKEFQKIYKKLYGMRFVTNEYITRYFNLLNTKKFNTQNELSNLLNKMNGVLDHQGQNSMQFVFATKLLHTANDSLPIYDSFVDGFFRLEAVPNDVNLDVKYRIETRKRIYDELVKKFNSLLSEDKIKKYIKEIRIILGGTDSISNAKMLDFIILSCEGGFNKNLK